MFPVEGDETEPCALVGVLRRLSILAEDYRVDLVRRARPQFGRERKEIVVEARRFHFVASLSPASVRHPSAGPVAFSIDGPDAGFYQNHLTRLRRHASIRTRTAEEPFVLAQFLDGKPQRQSLFLDGPWSNAYAPPSKSNSLMATLPEQHVF